MKNTGCETGCVPSLLHLVITKQGRDTWQSQLYPPLGDSDHVPVKSIPCMWILRAARKMVGSFKLPALVKLRDRAVKTP